MQRIKRNNFPKSVLDRQYEVDGTRIDLREWLNINFYKHLKEHRSVTKVAPNDVGRIIDLEPGHSVIIGTSEIKRLS